MTFLLKGVKNLKVIAWRIKTENEHDFTYYVQVNDVVQQKQVQIYNLFSGWNQVGIGWNEKSDHASMFIYAKNFRNEHSWTSWANNFPYTVQEQTA